MGKGVQVVVGPEKGGIILSQWTAFWLQTWNTTHDVEEVLGVYAEKTGGCFVFNQEYGKLVTGKRILVVEDVLTTGGSVKKVAEAVRVYGGDVIGVGALVNRGGVTPKDINVPKLFSLVNAKFDAWLLDVWNETNCPLCKQNIPINTDIGHGREFLAHLDSTSEV